METELDLSTPNSAPNPSAGPSTSQQSSSTGCSSSSVTSNTHQDTALEMLKQELNEKRYWSTTRQFVEHFAATPNSSSNSPPVDYRAILKSIDQAVLAAPSNHPYTPNSITWPPNGSPERTYYEPLLALIQRVQDSDSLSASGNIIIFPYDRNMRESSNSSWPLKPDGLGAVKEKQRMAWKDVEIAVEVKDNDASAFIQVASYARAILAARPGLQYAVAITFNHRKFNLQYHIFSRSCVSSCVPLPISTAGGYRNFVRITAAFLSALGGNEDFSQDSSFMLIPGHLLRIHDVLTQRICIVGRATRVVRGSVVETVEDQEPNKDSQHLVSEVSIGDRHLVNYSKKGEVNTMAKSTNGSRTAEGLVPHSRERLLIRYLHEDRNFGSLSRDTTLVIKDSWPPVSKATQEIDILALNRGRWGIAQIYAGYQVVPYRLRPVCAPTGARLGKECTAEDVQREAVEEERDVILQAPPLDNSSSMVASGSATVVLESAIPLARTHVRIVFKTKGVPLTTVMDDKVRIKAILDAVIGHYSCFESGWLHGDVSLGNVLFMPDGESGSLPQCFKHLGWTIAHGLLIDFDLSAPWEDESKPALIQSGTLPFTSSRLLSAWKLKQPCVRFPADDLESFSWLWLWTLLSIGRQNEDLCEREEGWISQLEASITYTTSHATKAAILSEMEESLEDYPKRTEDYSLFFDWIHICRAHRKFVLRRGGLNIRDGSARSKPAVIEEELNELYMKFINRGVKYMSGNKSSVTDNVSTPMEE